MCYIKNSLNSVSGDSKFSINIPVHSLEWRDLSQQQDLPECFRVGPPFPDHITLEILELLKIPVLFSSSGALSLRLNCQNNTLNFRCIL